MDGNSINTRGALYPGWKITLWKDRVKVPRNKHFFYNRFGDVKKKKNLRIKKNETTTGFLNEELLQILDSSSR